MISAERAKRFTEKHFPSGPEKLAEKLGVDIQESPLAGCDGWVLSGPAGIIIRLNNKASLTRRRFTLAHELGHLLLDVPTIVGERIYDSFRNNSAEERKVNDLAAELLLPESVVRKYFPSVPVVAAELKKLARKANISELAAAIRVTNVAAAIGLINASVFFFKNDVLEWHWSKTLEVESPSEAGDLLKQARASYPAPVRIQQTGTNEVVVASLINNRGSGFATLFVQLLPADSGNAFSREEVRQRLEQFLFENDSQFRTHLQGVFGYFLPRCKGLKLEAGLEQFYREKVSRLEGERRKRLESEKGREYVRLRLQEWCG